MTRVACVNKHWNEVSRDKLLWSYFHPVGIKITSFSKMIEYLNQRGTKHLNWRNSPSGTKNSHKCVKAIYKIHSVKKANIAKSSFESLQKLFLSGPGLHTLSIDNADLFNLGPISMLTELRELYIKHNPIL